ncbi:beta-lactamase-like [Candidatus Vecturithrix granuli]|uniref:Beta-lactamase-like n=1 Tax=Vecturithrix granuli TaxID=1499967 RepID=A0A081C841_VECG1|nr:beta-lactamase-like [Candidatus Vecturithrix granuli]
MTDIHCFDHSFGITTIDTGFVRPGFDASHLIIEGDQAAFVDVGVSSAVPLLLQVLQNKHLAPEQVKYLILTHIHLDHAGAAGSLLAYLPYAQVVVHPRGVRYLAVPKRLVKGSTTVYGEARMASLFGEVLPVPSERIIAAKDHTRLDLNGRSLLLLDTAGHARHHICIVDEGSQGIFTGDTFGLSYREFDTEKRAFMFPTTPPMHFDPEAMHASIDQLLTYQPQMLYLTHFGAVSDVCRLAHDLHEGIAQFTTLARGVSAQGEERTQQLTAKMQALLLTRLRAHGCQLEETRIMDLLAPDIMLNVMGLEVWLDKTRG